RSTAQGRSISTAMPRLRYRPSFGRVLLRQTIGPPSAHRYQSINGIRLPQPEWLPDEAWRTFLLADRSAQANGGSILRTVRDRLGYLDQISGESKDTRERLIEVHCAAHGIDPVENRVKHEAVELTHSPCRLHQHIVGDQIRLEGD